MERGNYESLKTGRVWNLFYTPRGSIVPNDSARTEWEPAQRVTGKWIRLTKEAILWWINRVSSQFTHSKDVWVGNRDSNREHQTLIGDACKQEQSAAALKYNVDQSQLCLRRSNKQLEGVQWWGEGRHRAPLSWFGFLPSQKKSLWPFYEIFPRTHISSDDAAPPSPPPHCRSKGRRNTYKIWSAVLSTYITLRYDIQSALAL